MTNRRKPSRQPSSSWNPGRPRAELAKAIGGAAGVVVLTALLIFVMKPGDSSSSTPAPTPTQTVPAGSTGSGGSTGSTGATGGTGSTGTTDTTAPAPAPTAPAPSSTQP